MAQIEVEGLHKSYGETRAVAGISFSVAAGEIFGILGPNGAGKTTTLEILEGLREADGGSVSVLGLKPWPRNPTLIARIGVQLQSTAFFHHLTVREQLELFARLYGVGRERAGDVLALVGLEEKRDTRTEKLSGGQAQRLSIALALVHDPEIVFLDEPTAALDPQARRNLLDVVRAIRERGKTVVLTTHYMDEAEELCDRVAIIDGGIVLALDSPETLVRGLDAPTRIEFAARDLTLEAVAALPAAFDVEPSNGGFLVATRDPGRTLAALAGQGAIEGVRVWGGTLEDVFLRLTGREYRA